MQLLLYKNCKPENEVLKEYVLSFNSRNEIGDEVLNICKRYSKLYPDPLFYIASAYNLKGKEFRSEFIKYALRYMENPVKNKLLTTYLLRDLSKAYASEYEFYEAINICDKLSGPDYEYINANLTKADCLLKIRKMSEAIKLLETTYESLAGRYKLNSYNNEQEKSEDEISLRLFEKALEDYRKKESEGYIYVPATDIGKEKLKKLLIDEGRYIENITFKKQTEADFDSFVCFDFEMTGLSSRDKITEIGAVKVVKGKVKEYFSELVNPKRPIPEKVTEITGITNDIVKDKETIYKVLPRFLEFIGDNILVAHKAAFDCSFLLREAENLGKEFKNPVLDTLALAKKKIPGMSSYNLESLTKHLSIKQTDAHRAYCDAEATAKLYLKLKKI